MRKDFIFDVEKIFPKTIYCIIHIYRLHIYYYYTIIKLLYLVLRQCRLRGFLDFFQSFGVGFLITWQLLQSHLPRCQLWPLVRHQWHNTTQSITDTVDRRLRSAMVKRSAAIYLYWLR